MREYCFLARIQSVLFTLYVCLSFDDKIKFLFDMIGFFKYLVVNIFIA